MALRAANDCDAMKGLRRNSGGAPSSSPSRTLAQAGTDWKEHGLIFPSRIGTPMEPDNLRRSWGRIRAAAGLDEVRLHDTRHTCVSLLLALSAAGHESWKYVAKSDL
jgi:integrase